MAAPEEQARVHAPPASGERALVVDVLFTPAELGHELRLGPTDVAMVIDVIRATTTLTVLFDRGGARVLVAGDIPEARAFAAGQSGAYLLAGEVGGLRPPGFDFGNSPVEIAAADLRGREIIFATTNGTRALHACVGAGAGARGEAESAATVVPASRHPQAPAAAGAVLAGSLRNAQAVCRAALRLVLAAPAAPLIPPREPLPGESASEARGEPEQTGPRLVIVCSGRLGRPALDDTFCAGVLLEHLERLAPPAGWTLALRDGARLARLVAAGTPDGADLLRASAAGQAVVRVGLEADLAFCAAVDASQSVPQVVGIHPAGLLMLEDAAP